MSLGYTIGDRLFFHCAIEQVYFFFVKIRARKIFFQNIPAPPPPPPLWIVKFLYFLVWLKYAALATRGPKNIRPLYPHACCKRRLKYGFDSGFCSMVKWFWSSYRVGGFRPKGHPGVVRIALRDRGGSVHWQDRKMATCRGLERYVKEYVQKKTFLQMDTQY